MAIGAMVVGSVYSANKQSKAAKSAGRAQAAASDRAGQIQLDMYNQTKERLDPFIDAATGGWAQGDSGPITGSYNMQQAMSGAMGPGAQAQAYEQYGESPGVAWQREQGMRGLEAGMGASGRGGGSRLKALSQFNQGLAMQDFQNQFNRLGAITGTAVSAAGALGGAGISSAQGQSQAAIQTGQAQAGAVLGRANAISSGINSLTSLYASR